MVMSDFYVYFYMHDRIYMVASVDIGSSQVNQKKQKCSFVTLPH